MPDSPCCCESNPIEFRYAGSDPGRHGAGNSTASVVPGTRRWRVRAISPYLETGNVQALLTTWNLQGRAHRPVCVLKCLRWMKQTVKTYSPTAFSLPCKLGFTGCAGTDGPRGMQGHTLSEDGQSVTGTSKPVECLIHQKEEEKTEFCFSTRR